MKRDAAIYSIVTIAMAILLVASCRKGDGSRRKVDMTVKTSYEDSGYSRSCLGTGQTARVVQIVLK
jgi:hypothetical protein